MSVSTLQYLDKAMNQLRDLGLVPEKVEEAPVLSLLQRIADIDEEKSIAIARTLSQASVFNDVVREQISQMKLGERYKEITEAFNSIRDDAKSMVEQVEDGKIDTFERIGNVWMKVTRGDIASRFDDIKETYLDVTASTNDQIQRENKILEAYQDFRGALKQCEVLALEVLNKADANLATAKHELAEAMQTVDDAVTAGVQESVGETVARVHRHALEHDQPDPALRAALVIGDKVVADLAMMAQRGAVGGIEKPVSQRCRT